MALTIAAPADLVYLTRGTNPANGDVAEVTCRLTYTLTAGGTPQSEPLGAGTTAGQVVGGVNGLPRGFRIVSWDDGGGIAINDGAGSGLVPVLDVLNNALVYRLTGTISANAGQVDSVNAVPNAAGFIGCIAIIRAIKVS